MENRQIQELQSHLQQLIKQQEGLSGEIRDLQQQVNELAGHEPVEDTKAKPALGTRTSISKSPKDADLTRWKIKPDLEKFIGENLISKIGIIIIIIGVGIGSKYAIDRELVNPLTRIILGYLVGFSLMGFALRLRKRYIAFSAVLLSGALAIMYLLTFAGYSFYGLFPKAPTFGSMVILTVCAVWAAWKYNRSIIAHIGLVGSYAVPFLLSDGSGQILYLFVYMTIINTGILIISIRKYWQSLYYSAFGFTWLIYLVWYLDSYSAKSDFILGFVFLSIFFVLFYATFLTYKLVSKKPVAKADIFLTLANSFTYYAFGFALLSRSYPDSQLVGLYTLANAVLHGVVAGAVKIVNRDNKQLFALILALGIVFLTITIPVQLNGSWIPLLWVGEAMALFWVGRTQQSKVYERLAYPLFILSFGSLVVTAIDRWQGSLGTPFLNVDFLTSLIYVAIMCFANWVHLSHSQPRMHSRLSPILAYGLPVFLVLSAYGSFAMEIVAYWQRVPATRFTAPWIREGMQHLWLLIYSVFYVSVLSYTNLIYIRRQTLSYAILAMLILLIPAAIEGFVILESFRDQYLNVGGASSLLWVRYVLYGFIVGFIIVTSRLFLVKTMIRGIRYSYELAVYSAVLLLVGRELVHWLELLGYMQSDKLGLSILWGVGALVWIGVGITQGKKHLRIGAIVLFGLTLTKLFFYDISHLDTLSKTVVFVILGMLLLVISFLYNRYKHLIQQEEESSENL